MGMLGTWESRKGGRIGELALDWQVAMKPGGGATGSGE